MEPVAFVSDKIRGFTKSTQELFSSLVHGLPQPSARRHPSTHGEKFWGMIEAFVPPLGTNSQDNRSTGSVALTLESELDEFTKLGGWIEMKQSNPKHLEWAVTVADDSEDSVGCGIGLNGILAGPNLWDRFQAESYWKFNLGKRFSVKPGVAYICDGNAKMTAFMLRSSWSL